MNTGYVPTIGKAPWNIKELSRNERMELKKRLVVSMVTTEEEYQRVISYMYMKYPKEMDITDGKNLAIQWRYSVARNKLMVRNSVTQKMQDMYAFIVYDAERDMEPVAFAGSYFKLANATDAEGNGHFICDANGHTRAENILNGFTAEPKINPYRFQRVGFGYVLFIDPDYRRMGLATDLWYAEAALYRDALNIRYQREIQNEDSLKVTQSMFSDPSKCVITSLGRLKADGTHSQIRCLLDYTDSDLVNAWNEMPANLKTIYNGPNWRFMEREGLTAERLHEIFVAGKL